MNSLGYFGLSGLAAGENTFLSDMDGDGDLDLYMGRQISDGKFYYHSRHEPPGGGPGSDEPDFSWVGVRVPGWIAGLGNTSGATVVVREYEDGPVLGAQVLGSGDGKCGRDEMRCLFGLGDYGGNVNITLELATGAEVDISVSTGSYHEFAASDFVSGSLVGQYYGDPLGSQIHWEFSWDTRYTATNERDEVRVIPETFVGGCLTLEQMVLTQGVEGVVIHQVTQNPDGTWHHRVAWEGDCSPCAYDWEVSSWLEGSSVVNETGNYKIKSCLGM